MYTCSSILTLILCKFEQSQSITTTTSHISRQTFLMNSFWIGNSCSKTNNDRRCFLQFTSDVDVAIIREAVIVHCLKYNIRLVHEHAILFLTIVYQSQMFFWRWVHIWKIYRLDLVTIRLNRVLQIIPKGVLLEERSAWFYSCYHRFLAIFQLDVVSILYHSLSVFVSVVN